MKGKPKFSRPYAKQSACAGPKQQSLPNEAAADATCKRKERGVSGKLELATKRHRDDKAQRRVLPTDGSGSDSCSCSDSEGGEDELQFVEGADYDSVRRQGALRTYGLPTNQHVRFFQGSAVHVRDLDQRLIKYLGVCALSLATAMRRGTTIKQGKK